MNKKPFLSGRPALWAGLHILGSKKIRRERRCQFLEATIYEIEVKCLGGDRFEICPAGSTAVFPGGMVFR
jgi:hypothetical protein